MPCHVVPQLVARLPSGRIRPATRFTPAKRAPKKLRGFARTSAAVPDSTTRPASNTTTRSASVTTSSRSWVTSTADRPSRASTRRNTLRMADATATSSPVKWFVEEQDVGVGGQRAGERDALSLPPES